jgi:hypothetical protein
MKRLLCICLVVTVIGVMTASSTRADVYWESIQKSQSLPGKPDETKPVRQYLCASATRMENDNQITIVDFDGMKIYHITPSDKTYTEMNIASMGAIPNMDGQGKEMLSGIMKQMMGTVKVAATQEKKTIGGYHCQKYQVGIMGTSGDYWLSKAVPGYDEIKEISRKAAKAFESNPLLRQSNIMAIMGELDGFPVETDIQLMGGRIITTVTKIETRVLDPKLFKTPDGYQKITSGNPP